MVCKYFLHCLIVLNQIVIRFELLLVCHFLNEQKTFALQIYAHLSTPSFHSCTSASVVSREASVGLDGLLACTHLCLR